MQYIFEPFSSCVWCMVTRGRQHCGGIRLQWTCVTHGTCLKTPSSWSEGDNANLKKEMRVLNKTIYEKVLQQFWSAKEIKTIAVIYILMGHQDGTLSQLPGCLPRISICSPCWLITSALLKFKPKPYLSSCCAQMCNLTQSLKVHWTRNQCPGPSFAKMATFSVYSLCIKDTIPRIALPLRF